MTGEVQLVVTSVAEQAELIRAGRLRPLAVLLALLTFVYLYIPRVDFFMSIVFFLSYFIPAFALDSMPALRKLSAAYGGISLAMVLLFVTPAADAMNSAFMFATDVLVLAATVALNVYAARLARETEERRKLFRTGLIVSITTPLILTPVFRFLLLVPLPHEGGIVQLMQVIYYSLR